MCWNLCFFFGWDLECLGLFYTVMRGMEYQIEGEATLSTYLFNHSFLKNLLLMGGGKNGSLVFWLDGCLVID